ncbi:LysR family transcriptional regulator [Sinisalibacter lacisalsi]|uniref:HTH-type transcriptional regulator CbbR n=1 Tax=Sinisalibacter lacisalsi TaxID=1526570 RepID=A0ABQ1QPJ8_9RHOB|nr:LysR family transcriptional regulator [Sinisalibacter lacisalsi]GGD39524.1 transcriptional regulator [Sinisalibacter lacisalsi]
MPTPKKRTLLKKLFVFEAIARNLSFTRAAQELGVSQPNVSIQLRQLEEEIGAPLIEQNGRKLSMTRIGETLYPHCQAIRQELLNTQVCIERLKGIKQGQVSLYIAAPAKYFTPTLIAAFQRDNPGTQFDLHVFGRAEMIAGLQDNACDLIVIADLPDETGLTAVPFLEDPLVLIANPGHPLANAQEISLAEVAAFPFLLREEEAETRAGVDAFLAEHDLDVALIANSNEAIKSAVAAGMGLSFVTRQSVIPEVAAGQLVILDTAIAPPRRTWHLVHRDNKRFSHVAEAFHEFVTKQAARVIDESNSEVWGLAGVNAAGST